MKKVNLRCSDLEIVNKTNSENDLKSILISTFENIKNIKLSTTDGDELYSSFINVFFNFHCRIPQI